MKKPAYSSFSFNLALPVVRESSGQAMLTPHSVRELLEDAAQLAQEGFFVLTLNKKNRLIDRHLITLGILDASLVHPREVFRPAILDGAAAVILAHNHPSGDPTPSADDIALTRKFLAAGKTVDIRVLDHVILGRGDTRYHSLRESGLASFED